MPANIAVILLLKFYATFRVDRSFTCITGQTKPIKTNGCLQRPRLWGAQSSIPILLQSSTVENVASDSAEQILAVSLFSEETTLFDHNLAP